MDRTASFALILILLIGLLIFTNPNAPDPTTPSLTEPATHATEQPFTESTVPPSQPTEPEGTKPSPTEPAPTESEPTEPVPTEPEPTEPVPTDPEPTEPAPTEPAPTQPQPKDPTLPLAPNFVVFDASGKAVTLADFAGKPIVINFWASWCGPCRSEMPAFQAAYEIYGDEVQFLVINLTDNYYETVHSAQSFINQQGYTFPVYFDLASSGAEAYSVYSIPATFFVDPWGYLVAQHTGAMDLQTLQSYIAQILP